MQVPGTNLYDVLQRVRPLWLITDGTRARSVNVATETAVLTDGRYFGDVGSLRQIPVGGVQRIRYLTGSDAANTYAGSLMGRHVDAVIAVEFGNPDPPMASN
jgi:hypothetical protein